jgi:hypothetical protein
MKDIQKIKEFFSQPMKESLTGGYPHTKTSGENFEKITITEPIDDATKDKMIKNFRAAGWDAKPNNGGGITAIKKAMMEGNKEYFKPSIRKDKSNPNFLYVDISYPEGSDVLSVGGSKTMGGQDRESGAAKALSMGNAIVKKLEAKYNIEDIEVKDLKNGKVEVFAVSDDFTKMASPSLDEAKKETAVDMAKKQLDALGVKYELGNEFKPFKVIYKPTGQSDEFYDTFEDIVDLFSLKGVVKSSMNEAKEEDKVDTITMDIPLFLRMLEYSREDASQDMDLHDVTEKAISLGKERGILQMDDYDEIIGSAEEMEENVAPNHDGKSAPYGSGYKPLEERIAKALDQISEELCPAGKAYRKRRIAAGEKSSAYLSGRAVKVCKGQMSGKKKKK